MDTHKNQALKEACDRLFNTLLAVCPAHKCECGKEATKRCEGCGIPICTRHSYDIAQSGKKTHCADCYDRVLHERYLEFVGGRAG